MATDDDEPEDPTDIDQLDATDAADQRVQDIADQRQWLESCLTAVSTATSETVCSDEVRSALDALAIAAMARAKRILRSDLGRGK